MENMDAEESIICCICKITDILCTDFVEIGKSTADNSKKPLISVINHLLQWTITEGEITITTEDVVCNNCYHEILEYDGIMMKLLNFQKRFRKLLVSCKTSDNLITEEIIEQEEIAKEDHSQIFDSNEIEIYETEELSSKEIEFVDLELSDVETEGESLDSPGYFQNEITTKTKCNYCDKNFFSKQRLNAHIEREHAIEGVFRCNICRKIFRNDEYLELHMNLHEGKTEYDCRYCSKRFSRKVNVIRHMQKHWNKQNFQCEKCGLRFSYYTLLYNHKLQHQAEEMPLVCAVCQQTFKTKRTYEKHLLTHSDERVRYPCDACGKRFLDKYTLKVHRRSHEHMSQENHSK